MTDIIGTSGDDTLAGTAGDDRIEGGEGTDVINGGAGDDVISDRGGSSTIVGGLGNDRVEIRHSGINGTMFAGILSTDVIDTGEGDDFVLLESFRQGQSTIDLGSGNDSIRLVAGDQVNLTLGEGRDRVTLDRTAGMWAATGSEEVIINDFAAGAAGDSLELSEWLEGYFQAPIAEAPANPFASGHFILVQDGADTLIQIDRDGTEIYQTPRTIIRLRNVSAAELTWENFAGYSLDGSPPVAINLTGTAEGDHLDAGAAGGAIDGLAGNDHLTGGAGADVLRGGDGRDDLMGGSGEDHLEGGEGDDVLEGGLGTDWLQGGAGNDVLLDIFRGNLTLSNDTLDGGDGDDLIRISRHTEEYWITDRTYEYITVFGGAGNDRVEWDSIYNVPERRTAALTVDLGSGNDIFYLGNVAQVVNLTLGSGQDRIDFGQHYILNTGWDGSTAIVVADFEAGTGGDVLEVATMLFLQPNMTPTANAFQSGHLQLVQQGEDVIVIADYDGFGGVDSKMEVARLVGVDAATLTAFNFGGYDPSGVAPRGLIRAGTERDDVTHGWAGNDQLKGAGGSDELHGSTGNDILDGGAGDDRLEGGEGNDRLIGGVGDDLLEELGGGVDILQGNDGNDHIILDPAFWGSDRTNSVTVYGGAGSDTVDVRAEYQALIVDLGSGDDRLNLEILEARGSATFTLGAGSDVVYLTPSTDLGPNVSLVITDFEAGDGGDRLDWLYFAQNESGTPASNPFGAGYARLLQSGTDVLLQIDTYHFTGRSTNFVTMVTFRNADVADFTDYNFGIDISARPPVPEVDTHVGTSAADVIVGTSGRDLMSGLDGADTLSGEAGDDVLRGNAGADILNGGDGADVIEGGDKVDRLNGDGGNDVITDQHGADIITGGAGNDRIEVKVDYAYFIDGGRHGSVNAGEGDDFVSIYQDGAFYAYTALLGAGNDHVRITGMAENVNLTLGAGRDLIEIPQISIQNSAYITVSDFQTGAGGDRVDISGYLDWVLSWNRVNYWAPYKNPFELGYLELRQVGADVMLFIQRDGLNNDDGDRTILFKNTTVDAFTAENFSGYDPRVPVNSARLINEDTIIAAGETITALNTTPFNSFRAHFVYESSMGAQFVNHGVITTRETTSGGYLTGFTFSVYAGDHDEALFHNASDGQFIVEDLRVTPPSNLIDIYGFYADRPTMSFRNDGHFEVRSPNGDAFGIWSKSSSSNPDRLLTNTGTIVVEATLEATGITAANIVIDNRGTLLVHGGEFAIGIDLELNSTAPVLRNSGIINVSTGPDSPWQSVGIYFTQSDLSARFVNSGSISADIAIYGWRFNEENAPSNLITNTGSIDGAVWIGSGDDRIVNSGTMSGRTILGGGDDRYEGGLGYHTGTIEGGNGEDTLVGGRRAELFFGGADNDYVTSGAGNDYVEGGSGNDLLDGGAGFDTLSHYESLLAVNVDIEAGIATGGTFVDYFRNFEEVIGSRGSDVIAGSSVNDTLLGAQGDDSLDGRVGDDLLAGGTGNDLLTGGTGRDRFIFQMGGGRDIVTDFRGGDAVVIHGYTAYRSMEQIGADVRITFSATDSLLLRGVTLASLTSDNLLFTGAPAPGDFAEARNEILVTRQDLVISEGISLSFGDTDQLVPHRQSFSGAAIVLDAPNDVRGLTLWNAGTIGLETHDADAVTMGTFTAATGGREHRLVNDATGRIEVVAHGSDAVGVTGIAAGTWNAGTIGVTSLSGDAIGVRGPGTLGDACFVNSGTIEVDAARSAEGVGSGMSERYFNSGTIDVSGAATSNGLVLDLSAHPIAFQPILVNSGTVSVTDQTAAKDSAGILFGLSSRATFWNSGTIRGDYAIRFDGHSQSGSDYGLTVYNSGRLEGLVQLSAYDDRLINNRLITGDVSLGAGDDFFDGRRGTFGGLLDGGDGNDTLLAGAGAQRIVGGGGDDILSGGAGADDLTGGFGRDAFRVEAGSGHDVVTDFAKAGEHDFIEVTGYSAYQSIVQSGSDVLITFSAADSLLIRNATVEQINAAMFRFGVPVVAPSKIPETPVAPSAPEEPSAPSGTPRTFPPVNGTAQADVLAGGSGPDDLRGLGGDDTIQGGSGPDLLSGGDGADALTGGDGDDRLDGGTGADTLDGGWGDDHYIVDNAGDRILERAGRGHDLVTSSRDFTLASPLDDLVLTGTIAVRGTGNSLDNRITGNALANVLTGGGGNDRLDGGTGADKLYGGAGNDFFVVDNRSDLVVEALTGGVDHVESSVSFTLANNIENLTLKGSAIDGIGNGLANMITGNGWSNKLDGRAGADTLSGGGGDDIYFVDNAGDRVLEDEGYGYDTVNSSVSFTLGRTLESLVLIGTAAINGSGNEFDNDITGNAAANRLTGGTGDDRLDGGGGDDRLIGGAGNDIYQVNTAGDRVVETIGAGTDTVKSSVDYVLGLHQENLELLGLAVSGRGNAYDNVITGNTVANILDGGAGADIMEGDRGSDIYIVDDAGDRVIETPYEDEVRDAVHSRIDFKLGAYVEELVLLGTAIRGTGNGYRNTLTGNGADNILDGGSNIDTMIGGDGDDTYHADNVKDVVTELADGGTDTVIASAATTLGGHVENLVLTGIAASGTGNDLGNAITGHASANLLKGLGGDDRLNGGGGADSLYGGAGRDRLEGGAGNDTFVFDEALGETNVDQLLDYSAATDTIALDRSVFTGIAGDGILAAAAFRQGPTAQDADDRILYDKATGNLWYDADGNGASEAILFATVTPGATLTNADFSAYP